MTMEMEEDPMDALVAPFGMEERNGRMICWLCGEDEETNDEEQEEMLRKHCETRNHQLRLQGLVKHPTLLPLLMIMMKQKSRSSSSSKILGSSLSLQSSRHWMDLMMLKETERSIKAHITETDIHVSTPSSNNRPYHMTTAVVSEKKPTTTPLHQETTARETISRRNMEATYSQNSTSSSIAKRTNRLLAVLSPEDANYEWRCESCGVHRMRSQEYWDHCLTTEHLERRQAAKHVWTTGTGAMKDRTNCRDDSNDEEKMDGSLDPVVANVVSNQVPLSPLVAESENLRQDKQQSQPCNIVNESACEQPSIVTPTHDKRKGNDSMTLDSTTEDEATSQGDTVDNDNDDEEEDMFDGMSVLQTPSPVKPQSMAQQTPVPHAISFETNPLSIWTDSLRKVIDDTKSHHDMIRPKTLLGDSMDCDDNESVDDDEALLFAEPDSGTTQVDSNERKLQALLNELALC